MSQVTTVAELLARARSAQRHRTAYKLGAGGMNPAAAHPAAAGACDCSGFVAWALGLSRETKHPIYRAFNGGWINTDAIVHDARTEGGLFTRIQAPVVGALAVYGAKRPARAYGHVGIITEVEAGAVTRVLHCSSGNGRKGDAIQETGPTAFLTPDCIYAWPVALGTPPGRDA